MKERYGRLHICPRPCRRPQQPWRTARSTAREGRGVKAGARTTACHARGRGKEGRSAGAFASAPPTLAGQRQPASMERGSTAAAAPTSTLTPRDATTLAATVAGGHATGTRVEGEGARLERRTDRGEDGLCHKQKASLLQGGHSGNDEVEWSRAAEIKTEVGLSL